MSFQPPLPRTTSEPRRSAGAWILLLALGLASPAGAEEVPAKKAANWTVFLTTGSTMAASEVHHDVEHARYAIQLPSGGTIQLSETAVRRVSRETADRVEQAAPVVAASTGSVRAGAAPGSVDSSSVRLPSLRTPTMRAGGDELGALAADKLRAGGGKLQADGASVRSAREERLTPKRGQMERMLRRVNGEGVQPRRAR